MSKKILVADDQQEVIDLLKVALTSSGNNYNVIGVSHGSLLPELVYKEKPDLLILDVLLPGMDGYSLQLQFSQQESTKNMPVIVLTALPAAKALFEKFTQVKMFIAKPFKTEVILEKVKGILG